MKGETTMRSTVCTALGRVEILNVPKPGISHPRDAIVRVTATSICGSDLHMIDHPEMVGSPIGHEFVGVVEETGDGVGGLPLGTRVVGPAAVWCGSCAECRRGNESFCSNGGIFGCGPEFGSLGGAQSEWIRVPFADLALAVIPDSVSDAQALAVGDALSTGWSGVRRVINGPTEVLLVLGCGPIGLSAVSTAKLHGVRHVVAVDLHETRRRLAVELGASAALGSVEEAVVMVRELTGGRGADGVVDAAGAPATIAAAFEALGIGGRIAILGLASKPIEVDFLSLLYKSTTVWAGLGDLTRMGTLLTAIESGVFEPGVMFTETIELGQIVNAYSAIAAGGTDVVKYLVTVP
ncbi:zinc-dependent alcohol dehydrogenase [Arthrobacter sulfonylureivorans]|uniref:Alcohol dehydrogenase catalytic domain-containing protein n=1 Tax=Arthrobacter sulfonylureivorans TaxID=2486855 RepID=A0ABY3WGR9_9MICC|nr:alcohol dehydrogenase catalytic domain-containing protein [Arthrobacter sulfonylureivorans]UNK47753.1 alcohol dehydrogenase catalytic domain-containing protein [Arthrobacter sulfonylureivorans]